LEVPDVPSFSAAGFLYDGQDLELTIILNALIMEAIMGGAHPAFSLLPGNGFFDISQQRSAGFCYGHCCGFVMMKGGGDG
jgi:hypothetical protein